MLDAPHVQAYAELMIIGGNMADDVMTAGATVSECSRVLKKRGRLAYAF
jgi:orotate phosphoribosyltransferase-like protein